MTAVIPWSRPEVAAAVLDFGEAFAATAVAVALDQRDRADAQEWAVMRHAIRGTAASPSHATMLARRAQPSWSDPAFAATAAARVRLGEAEWSRRVRASWVAPAREVAA